MAVANFFSQRAHACTHFTCTQFKFSRSLCFSPNSTQPATQKFRRKSSAQLCCTRNRRCESSRVTSPLRCSISTGAFFLRPRSATHAHFTYVLIASVFAKVESRPPTLTTKTTQPRKMRGLQFLMHHVHAIQIYALFFTSAQTAKSFWCQNQCGWKVLPRDVKMPRSVFHFTEKWKLFTCVQFTLVLRTKKKLRFSGNPLLHVM